MQIKLVIWDLDETLWQGTLAEGDTPMLFPRRAEIIRLLNQRGVVNAICSKNDPAQARATLEGMGLWEEFVFPHIAFSPKGDNAPTMLPSRLGPRRSTHILSFRSFMGHCVREAKPLDAL